MGLAYSLKCSLLCSYFYSLAPLFSFSFPHVLAPRVSLIPPGHLTSGILPRRHSAQTSHIRNSSPPTFHPDISHPEFFIAHSTRTFHIRNSSSPIPLGHLTSGILPPSTFLLRISHTRNSVRPKVPPSPDVSHPEFCPPNVQPSPDVSHPEFCLPTFHLLRMYHIWNSVRQHSTFSGCLTSGILSRRRPTFSGYLASEILSGRNA